MKCVVSRGVGPDRFGDLELLMGPFGSHIEPIIWSVGPLIEAVRTLHW